MSSNSAQWLRGGTFEWTNRTTTLCVQFMYIMPESHKGQRCKYVYSLVEYTELVTCVTDFTRRQVGSSEQVSDRTNLQMEYVIIKENAKASAENNSTANCIY
jgi:hypothetical protein